MKILCKRFTVEIYLHVRFYRNYLKVFLILFLLFRFTYTVVLSAMQLWIKLRCLIQVLSPSQKCLDTMDPMSVWEGWNQHKMSTLKKLWWGFTQLLMHILKIFCYFALGLKILKLYNLKALFEADIRKGCF